MLHLEKEFRDKDHIIFDWNGTLLNDIDLCVEVVGSLLTDHSLPKISREEYLRVFRFPVREYYVDIGFDFSKSPFEIIAEEFVKRYKERAWDCILFEGATDLLSEVRRQGKGTSLLSAAHEGHLRELLTHYKIEDQFDHVFGLVDNYAASKIDRGHELIRTLGIARERIIMVGDTDHDVEVAKALGIDILLLADGHQHADRLHAIHPRVMKSRYLPQTNR